MFGRGHIGDAGFGSPHGTVGEGGFGSPGLSDAGFGSPFPYDFQAISIGQPNAGVTVSTLTRSPGRRVGEEGGYLLDAVATSPAFDVEAPYRVDLVSSAGGTLPDTFPGVYSAVPGSPRACRALAGGRRLRFSSPGVPPGTYAVRILNPAGYEVLVPGALEVWRAPWAPQVDGIRDGLPDPVYYRKGTRLPLPDPESSGPEVTP